MSGAADIEGTHGFAALETRDLRFAYRDTEVLKGVELSVEEGRLCALLGKNGSGKSTLFGCILGINRGFTGKILLCGSDIQALPARTLSRLAAYVPQAHNPVFNYTVLDMVLMGRAGSIKPYSSPAHADIEAAECALDELGVLNLRDRGYLRLSGGERQLVLIARALAQLTSVIIMDEPTSGLDFGNRMLLMRTIRALSRQGRTIVFSTHDPQQALDYADDVIALSEGTVAAHGAPKDVITAELIQGLYGVSAELAEINGRSVLISETEQEG